MNASDDDHESGGDCDSTNAFHNALESDNDSRKYGRFSSNGFLQMKTEKNDGTISTSFTDVGFFRMTKEKNADGIQTTKSEPYPQTSTVKIFGHPDSQTIKNLAIVAINATTDTLALERKVEQDKLLKKALLGTRKKKVSKRHKPRGKYVRVVSPTSEYVPSIASEMHTLMINASSKAIGTEDHSSDEDLHHMEDLEIQQQAENKGISLLVYRQKLEDIEKVLSILSLNQRYNVQVHDYLEERFSPVDIPNQYRNFPAEKLQEDLEQLHSEGTPMITYEEVTDSYHRFGCVQCATFDCLFHQLEDDTNPMTLRVLAMEAAVAVLHDEDRMKTKAISTNDVFSFLDTPTSTHIRDQACFEQELSHPMQFALSRLKLIFENSGGDVESLNAALGGRYSKADLYNLPGTPMAKLNKNHIKRPGASRKMPLTVKKHIQLGPVDKDFFFPCSHEGKCSENNLECSCMQNHQLCTKDCVWGKYGANLFKGCGCKKGCKSVFNVGGYRKSACHCALANIECDPDICGCKGCQNQSMTNHRHKQFFLAPSTIHGAGWGLFTKYSISKDDFVGEVSDFLEWGQGSCIVCDSQLNSLFVNEVCWVLQ
jgi:hypothetical protein